MKNFFLIIALLFCQIAFSQWVKIDGLDSFSINSIAVNQTTGAIYAAASQNNSFKGVFYRPNLSSQWNEIYKGIASFAVNKLEIDSAGTLYLGTTNGVYYTNDNDSCISISQGLPTNFGIYPSVNSVSSIDSFLYIGTNAGIYRTLKNNFNWQSFSQNLPTGMSPNRITKYHNQILASYVNNVYRTDINISNWLSLNSISNGQGAFPPTINDMAVGDSAVYLAVEGAWSNAYKSIGDSMNFSACASTSHLTAYSIFALANEFWVGTFYGGIYKGNNYGNVLSPSIPNLPTWATVKSITRYGTALLVGTEYYSYQTGSGGLYYLDNIILATGDDNLKATLQDEFVTIDWESEDDLEINQFELQRSDDRQHKFKTIKIFNRNVNVHKYSYNDYDINQGDINLFYRLKRKDINGNLSFSKTIRVKLTKKTHDIFYIVPNPTTTTLKIKLSNFQNSKNYNFCLFNSYGSLILKKVNINQENFAINVASLPRGVYFAKIEFGQSRYSKTVILQ